MAYSEIFLVYQRKDLGTFTFICTSGIMMVTICLIPILLTVKSDVLAALLHDMSHIKGVSPPPTRRWYCKTKTIVFMLSMLMFTACMAAQTATSMKLLNIIGVVFLTTMSFLCGLIYLLPEEVPSMVFNILARRLLVATEATVATVSALLTPDGSFQCESDVKTAMVKLRGLEAVIREVGRKGKARHVISHAHTNIFTNKSLHTPVS